MELMQKRYELDRGYDPFGLTTLHYLDQFSKNQSVTIIELLSQSAVPNRSTLLSYQHCPLRGRMTDLFNLQHRSQLHALDSIIKPPKPIKTTTNQQHVHA